MAHLHICDKCNKNIGGLKIRFPFEVEEVPHYIIPRGRSGNIELCPKCNSELWKIIKKWLEGDS